MILSFFALSGNTELDRHWALASFQVLKEVLE